MTHEIELLTLAQQGDRNAFSDLVRSHYPGVINVVYRMCGDVQLAEDAAQDAFLKAWMNLNKFRPSGSLHAWFCRIAINAALDNLRQAPATSAPETLDLQLADTQPGPEAAHDSAERANQVQRAIMGLPPASRAVLVLREYEGLSYQEIASALEIPLGTVMSRLNYARSVLRERLAPILLVAEVENV